MQKVDDRLMVWGSDIDPNTILQAQKSSRLSIVHDHVALMPDAHVGIGATVGSVIPTLGAIIPAAVGVDIGCGMIAARLGITADQLPDNLDALLGPLEKVVPAGVGMGHRGNKQADLWLSTHKPHTDLDSKLASKASSQLGSLGSGNHFFEICLDEQDRVWVVLHSGSRGIGNILAKTHIDHAREWWRKSSEALEDLDLAYFLQGTDDFNAYLKDMLWAQEYAMMNRQIMMDAALELIRDFMGPQARQDELINCHHNFTVEEEYDGQKLFITRKGAIRARQGDRGIIPGSMGTRSYVVTGLGNRLAWNSCSHGAGRRMSRGQARRAYSATDLAQAMEGKVWLKNRAKDLVDEIPASYKDIDQVMADQADLVRIDHTLRQVLNYKGV